MKKLIALALALVLVLGCTAALADPVTLVYAEVNPLDTIVGKTATFFKETVEELSGGEIKIDIQASGVLGSEAQVLDGILMGGDTVHLRLRSDQLRLPEGHASVHSLHVRVPRAFLELCQF